MRLGTAYHVDGDDFECQVGRVLSQPEERLALGHNARPWYGESVHRAVRATASLIDEVRTTEVSIS
jgi:hypothetical protein